MKRPSQPIPPPPSPGLGSSGLSPGDGDVVGPWLSRQARVENAHETRPFSWSLGDVAGADIAPVGAAPGRRELVGRHLGRPGPVGEPLSSIPLGDQLEACP